MSKSLVLDLIRIDGGTQGRESISDEHVADLKSAWELKVELPPLVVFFDGTDYWLADGFHRYHAAQQAKRASVPCDIRKGTKRDAWMESLAANQGHGLRRSNADKRKLVTAALNDSELVGWADRRIAEHIGVSDPFVSSIRKELLTVSSSPAAKANGQPRVGKDGKKRQSPKSNGKPASTTNESTTQQAEGPLNDEPEKELSFEERVKGENGKIESFCRQLTAFYKDNCPRLASVDHLGRYDSAESQIRAACSTLRTCKYHEEPCPACKGEGCKKCEKESDFGAVTVLTYRQLAG